MTAVIGRKIGMSRFADADTGKLVPVTVVQVSPCDVLQVKTQATDGYESVVLGAFKKEKRGKCAGKQYQVVREFSFDGLEKGASVGVEVLEGANQVRISGVSKGRGFAGVVKKWNFATGRNTHGSHHHREPGSVGQCSKPGRIFKGKKLPGRYGNKSVTLRSVPVVGIDVEKGLVFVKGSVPGAVKGIVSLEVVS